MCAAFMFTAFKYQEADGNKTVPYSNTGICHCTDADGRIYNLAPLATKDGPRFAKRYINSLLFLGKLFARPCRGI